MAATSIGFATVRPRPEAAPDGRLPRRRIRATVSASAQFSIFPQFDDDSDGWGQLQEIGGRIQPPATPARSSPPRTRIVCLLTVNFLLDFVIVILAF